MTMIHIKTLARVVVYPLVFLIVGLVLGFAAYPQTVGHKLWLISWAYQSIFHPPQYNADVVTKIARRRLLDLYGRQPGFRIIDWREFGEEARDFLVEYVDEDGKPFQTVQRVWVRWKLWTQNLGEEIVYEGHGDRCKCNCIEVETVK